MCIRDSFNEKINTLIYQNKAIFIPHANNIFSSFASILKEIFDKPMYAIPWKLGKHCLHVLNELSDSQFLVTELKDATLLFILEQLLKALVYDRLELRGENGEGKTIANLTNKIVLKLMENSDPTRIIGALLEIFKKCKNSSMVPKVVARCLMKMCKAMKSLIGSLDIAKVLLLLHDFLSQPMALHSESDELGLRVVKNLLYEVVQVQGESIWSDYNRSIGQKSISDMYIKNWIKAMLPSKEPIKALQPEELKATLSSLKSQATFKETVKKLSVYMRLYPNVSVEEYLSKCSKPFKELVMSYLNRYMGSSSTEEVKEGAEFDDKAKTRFLIQKTGMLKNAEVDFGESEILFSAENGLDPF
eukprot:TRINITY_DN1455_c0_g1_i10.p1 TRINITY_DN1455_c0_g1~~TRINITY_DN1455_c0_g1_i10.p1  ORF type:complete len:360 (+),score=83.35 TRINITY_DN1455_c0_g1_i10:73-1152(+)